MSEENKHQRAAFGRFIRSAEYHAAVQQDHSEALARNHAEFLKGAGDA